jgi:sugar phosphate isomerase/epimerase
MSFTSRRTFLKATGAVAAAASMGIDRLAAAPHTMPIGLQLYSVRSLFPRGGTPDPALVDSVMAQARTAGYTVCEAAGYYGQTAKQFRATMDKAGIRCVSTHHALGQWRQQIDQLIEDGKTIGLEFMVCSSAGGQHKDPTATGELTVDDWRWVADEYNKIGEKVKAAGMTFGFHNHTGEYATIDGVWIYGELMRLTDPRYVVFEMDAGWVSAAGYDPVTMLKKAPERFQLMHVKDVAKGPDGKFVSTVVGRGKMDYHPIMAAATNLKQYFVEQEQFEMPVIQEITLEADYMRSLNVMTH